MSNPKPEHRITAVEKRVTHIEGDIEELADDTAEEFKALRQDNKTLFNHVCQGFEQAHAFVQERFEEIKGTLADHGKRLDHIETVQAEQSQMLKEILALLKQRPSE